ncbi:MAG: exopolysaccharide biosynthesis polyprenyl glycosylphosphotransferase [Lewinella sp.]
MNKIIDDPPRHSPEGLPQPPTERKIRPEPHRIGRIIRDFVLLNFSFYLAARLSYEEVGLFDLKWHHFELIAFINVVWALLSIRFGTYRWYEQLRIEQELAKLMEVFLFHLALVTLFWHHIQGGHPNSLFLLLAYAFAVLSVSIVRVMYRIGGHSGMPPFRYVVVGGESENLRKLNSAFGFSFQGAAELVGRFGITQIPHVSNIGGYEEIIPYLKTQPEIDKLIFFYSRLTHEQEREIVSICNNCFIDVEVAPRATSIFPRGYQAQQLGEMMMLTIKEEPMMLLRNKMLKRAFDLLFSFAVLVTIFPIMFIIVGILIKWESKGPIFFRQERSGYRNQVFRMIKFRTMAVNESSDEEQATVGDARITRIGAFLRRNSLDEFPQFINVFLGDMSVVGPRPHMLYHTEQYGSIIAPYMIRHKVKPGVTGWAQINGFRGPTDELWKMEKRVQHDVWYLENWSILLDIRCIAFTVINAIRGEENAI